MEKTALTSDSFSEALHFDELGIVKALCGEHDGHIRTIGKRLGVKIHVRGSEGARIT